MVNDVRVAGSPPMRFTFELAVQVSRTPAQRNVGLWYVAHESDANAFKMLLAGKQSFYTFTIPLDAEAVSWAAFKSVLSGRLLNVWHRARAFGVPLAHAPPRAAARRPCFASRHALTVLRPTPHADRASKDAHCASP